MSDLAQQELIRIRRAAEDAAYAMNRNYKPFIDVVSHPLNIITLVDMAQKSIKQQSKVHDIQKRFDAIKQLINDYHQHSYRESDDFVFYLEQALTGTNHIGEPNGMDGK